MKLPITGWTNVLRSLGYRVDWKAVERIRTRRYLAKKRQASELQYESLEPRQVLANTVNLINGQLQVTMNETAPMQFTLSTALLAGQSYVAVNGVATTYAATSVSSISVTGSPGADKIDLKAVNSLTFPNLQSGSITISGGNGDDVIQAPAFSATIYGGAGKDTIYGSHLADQIQGGDGDDLIHAGGGIDNVSGGLGDDQIFGGAGDDVLDGQAGKDTISGDDGDDHLLGGDEDDTLSGGAGDDQIEGGLGKDTLRGNDGDDVLLGGAGNDSLEGGLDDDQLSGAEDDDKYLFSGSEGLGLDVIHEIQTGGSDTLDFAGLTFTTGVTVDLSNQSSSQIVVGSGPTGVSIQLGTSSQDRFVENVIGSAKADTITGNELNNRLEGMAGDDVLVGTRGNDELFGGTGHDTLKAGILAATAPIQTRLEGGEGDDKYVIIHQNSATQLLDVTVHDQSGIDTLDLSTINAGATINLSIVNLIAGIPNLEVVLDSESNTLENVLGTEHDDIIIGNLRDNRLEGRGGRDQMSGGEGKDILLGGSGFDELEVIDQADTSFTSTSGWQSDTAGFNKGQKSVDKSTSTAGLQTASWTFSGLQPGKYEVFVTWAAHPNDVNGGTHGATNAKFAVSADSWQINETVNQRKEASGTSAGGVNWKQLGKSNSGTGILTVNNGTLTVTLSNFEADGFVYADAVRLVQYNQAPLFLGSNSYGEVDAPLTVATNSALNLALTASDPDGAASNLTFSLAANSPQGLTLVSTGPGTAQLSWPVAGRPQGQFAITVNVKDNGHPARMTSQTVFVRLGNNTTAAPVIQSITNLVGGTFQNGSTTDIDVNEETALSFQVSLAQPLSNLTYTLAPNAPAGASISSSGVFTWTPTEEQNSDDSYPIEIRVTDPSFPPRRAIYVVNVKVKEVSAPAALFGPISDSNESGVNPVVTGTVIDDGDFSNVQVLLKIQNGVTTSASGAVEIAVDVVRSETNPQLATFKFELDSSHFSNGQGGTGSLTVSARVREISPENSGNNISYSNPSNPLTISLDPSANVLPALPTASLTLQNDVGQAGQHMSSQPTIKGVVTHADGQVGGLTVRVYRSAPSSNGGLIETLRTNENGEFEVTIRGLDSAETVNLEFEIVEETAVGPLKTDPILFSFDYILNVAPEVPTLYLQYDSGSSSTDGITKDMVVKGTIAHSDGPLAGITIEFDDNSDNTIDGAAVTDESGNFVYRATKAGITAGSTLRARAVEWDDYRKVNLISAWKTLPLRYDPTANTAPGLSSASILSLKYPTVTGPVADPTLKGKVVDDGSIQNITIEFSKVNPTSPSFDRSKDLLGAVIPKDDGSFEFTPAGLRAGIANTIYARAVEWIPSAAPADRLLFGNATIQSVTLTISESPLGVTQFGDFELQYDTGSSGNDGLTSDPTVHGTVTYNGNYSQLSIEFSLGSSDEIIGTVVPTRVANSPNNQGEFSFTVPGLQENQLTTLRARVRVPDYAYHAVEFDDNSFDEDDYTTGYDEQNGWNQTQLNQWFDDVFNNNHTGFEGAWYNSDFDRNWDGQFADVTTPWQSVSFTLDLGENLSPTVNALTLVNAATSLSDPMIQGTVVDDGNVAGLKVEIWINGRDQADGFATTDKDGKFVYTMKEHTTGNNSIVVKIFEPIYNAEDPQEPEDFNVSQSATLSVTIAPNADYQIVNLRLLNGTLNGTDWEAVDPTLIGSVTGPGNTASLLVRFDFDNDGVIDAETRTDIEGNFEITPEGLTVNPTTQLTTVRAQVVKEVKRPGTEVHYRTFSSWSSLTWEVLPNTAPQIVRLELRNDTRSVLQAGQSYQTLDRITSNPILVGQVINDNGIEELVIEFDHDGDGIVDGTAETDENGYFEYTPKGLKLGGHNIRARVREFDPVLGDDLEFDYWPDDPNQVQTWASVTATGNPRISAANPAPVFYGFTLVAATPANVMSLSLANPGVPDPNNPNTTINLDPTLAGTVSDPDGSDTTIIEFFRLDQNNPVEFLGSTRPQADGTFRFTPVGLEFDQQLILAKARKRDFATDSDLFGNSPNPVSVNFKAIENSILSISNLHEQVPNDPFDTTWEGKVNITVGGQFNLLAPIFVEVMVNGEFVASVPVDSEVVGTGYTYRFEYAPELVSSNTAIDLKVRPVGRTTNGYAFGSWISTSFQHNLNLPSIGDRVQAGSGGGQPVGGSSSYGWDIEEALAPTPKMVGTFSVARASTNSTVTQFPTIEFDLDGDGKVDESVTAEETAADVYKFSHTFRKLSAGPVELKVRVTRYENVHVGVAGSTSGETTTRAETVVGNWETITFDVEDPAPKVLDLQLENVISSNPLTAVDATFTGRVEAVGNQSGTISGNTAVSSTVVTSPSHGLITGQKIMITGSNSTPSLDGIHQVTVTGTNTFTVNVNIQVAGNAGSWKEVSENLLGLTIEVDHNEDGTVDGQTVTISDGSFRYQPLNLSRDVNFGPVTLRVRAVDTHSQDEPLVGAWVDLEFNFQSIDIPQVTSLTLKFNEGTSVAPSASNATLEGKVVAHETAGLLTVEFDHDGDGIVDGTARVDYLGQFTYLPVGLVNSTPENPTHIIRARAVAQSGDRILRGDFAATSAIFAYTGAPEPTVADVEIVNEDNGELTGRLTLDGYGVVGRVQIAYLDGTNHEIDGTVVTDSTGYFRYLPQELLSGQVTLKVRALLGDPASTSAIFGDWQTVGTFDYDPAPLPTTLPTISPFRLAHDTGTSSTDNVSADATVFGKVGSVLPGMWVDISYDNFATVATSVRPRPDGTFSYKPSSTELTAHSNQPTIKVKTRVWNPDTGAYVVSPSSASLTFTYNPASNLPASITLLKLRDNVSPAGQTQTSNNPIFAGTVTNDGGAIGGLTVLFDHNGDGLPESSTTTNPDGSFTYRAKGLVAGASVQTISARVVEQDYRGNAIHGAPSTSLNFVLTASPLVSSMAYVVLTKGTSGEVSGTVSTPGSTSRHIEYQVFGNNGGNQNIPSSPYGYVPSGVLHTGTVNAQNAFTINLSSFNLGVGAAAAIVRVIDDTSNTTGPWELLNFTILPASYVPKNITGFGLVEDTGNSSTDGETSNSAFTGQIGTNGNGSFGIVEFTVIDVDSGGGIEPNAVYRATANEDGIFTWTAPNLTLGNEYNVEVRHVVFNPTTQQETLGSPSQKTLTFLDNNLQATILNFASTSTSPTLTGSVQDDGRIAGIRVEYDTDGDEEADGFTFTDANGDFEFTIYDLPAGQATTVRVRVVEWDGFTNQYVKPDFANVGSNQTCIVTLASSGPTSPEMGPHFNGSSGSSSLADSAALDAVFSHLGNSNNGNGQTGTINVAIGSIRLGVQDFSGAAEDTGFASNRMFTPAATRPTSNQSVNIQNQTIGTLATIGGGTISANGSNQSRYSLTKTVTVGTGKSTIPVTTNITYQLVVAKYTSDSQLNASSSSLEMTSTYTFTFSSTVNYSGNNIVSGSYTLTQNLTSTYLQTGTTVENDGSSSFSSAGTLTWIYGETNSTFSGGNLTQPYTSTITRQSNHWSNSNRQSTTSEPGFQSTSQGSSSLQTSSSSTQTASGTITYTAGVQSIVGTSSLTANGSSSLTFSASTSYSSSLGSGNSSSGNLSINGSSQGQIGLNVTTSYESNDSIDTTWSLTSSGQSTTSLNGSGQGSSVSANGTTSETWSFNTSSALESQASASGQSHVDLSTTNQVTTFTSSANSQATSTSGGSASGGVTWLRGSSGSGGSSESGSGQFSTSFSSSATVTGQVSAHGTKSGTNDTTVVTASGDANFNSTFSSLSSVNGESSSPNRDVSFGSISSSSVTSSGSSNYVGSETPDEISSAGSSTVSTIGTVLSASQSGGTITRNEGGQSLTIPFRNNQVSTGTLSVNGSMAGTYSRRLSDGSNTETYQSSGQLNSSLQGWSRQSSYVGIRGKYNGFHLEKSEGNLTEQSSLSMTDDNGTTNASGTFSSTNSGTFNSMTSVSGTDTSVPGTTISMSMFENTGGNVSENSAGIVTEDSTGRTTTAASGGSQQTVKGNSVSTMSFNQVTSTGTVSVNSSETMKFQASQGGSGTVVMDDEEIVSQSGSYGSDRFARMTSSQSMNATKNFEAGTSMMSSSNNAKFQMNEDDSVRVSIVGNSENSEGAFNSQTSGSVEMSGSMSASATYSGTGLSSQRVSMSSSFSGGGSMSESFGGGFVNSIVDAGGGGGDSSYSSSTSNMSISGSDETSSMSQSVASVSSSNDSSSYSVDIVQIGDIVGSGSATVSSSSSSGSVSTISSGSSSRADGASGWQSRNAVTVSSDSLSLSGHTNDLSGSNESPLEDADWHINWSMNSGSSIGGTVSKGSYNRIHVPASAENEHKETNGYSRVTSTQNLSMSDSFSAGQQDMIVLPVVITEDFSIDGSTKTVLATTTIPKPPPSSGNGNNGGNNNGGGAQSGGSGTTSNNAITKSDFTQVTVNANSLSYHTLTKDEDTLRKVAMANSVDRTTVSSSDTAEKRTGVANHVGWGKATSYKGSDLSETLTITDFETETNAVFQVDFKHDSLEYDLNNKLLMNNWIHSETNSTSNRLVIKASRYSSLLRFNNKHVVAKIVEDAGRVDYENTFNVWSTEPHPGHEVKKVTITATNETSNSRSTEIKTSGIVGREPKKAMVTLRSREFVDYEETEDTDSNATTMLPDSTIILTHTVTKSEWELDVDNTTRERRKYVINQEDGATETEDEDGVAEQEDEDKFDLMYRMEKTDVDEVIFNKTTITTTQPGDVDVFESSNETVTSENGIRRTDGSGHRTTTLDISEYNNKRLFDNGTYWNLVSEELTINYPANDPNSGSGGNSSAYAVGGDYDPNSRKQDGEDGDDELTPEEQVRRDLLKQPLFLEFEGQLKKWIEDGIAEHLGGNFYRIQTPFGAFVFELVSGNKMRPVSYAGPSIDEMGLGRTWGDEFSEWGSGALLTGKGYFWDTPVGIVTGVYDLAMNFGDVMTAIQFLKDHPIEGAKLLGQGMYDDFMSKLETPEGQGQIAGGAVASLIPISKLKLIAQFAKRFKQNIPKPGDLTKRLEENAARRLQEMESIAGDKSHFFKRHGAHTTIEQQYDRSMTGLTPDGHNGPIVDSGRFLSHRAQLNAVQAAIEIFQRTGKKVFTFEMYYEIGEGFTMFGFSLVRTSKVKVVFDANGIIKTMFPWLSPNP